MSAALISSGLDAKVEAVNLANSEALWLQRTLKPVFANYLGKQVVKKDGGLLAKVASDVAMWTDGPHDRRVWFFPSVSRYSVSYTVKSCVNFGDHSYYHEVPVYIGHLGHNGIKESISINSVKMIFHHKYQKSSKNVSSPIKYYWIRKLPLIWKTSHEFI